MNQFENKSDENWYAGCELLDKRPNAAANRIYYAVFQAVLGYGIDHDKLTLDDTDKHGQALSVADQTGPQGGYRRRVLLSLKRLRRTADYETGSVDSNQITKWNLNEINKVRCYFIKTCGNYG